MGEAHPADNDALVRETRERLHRAVARLEERRDDPATRQTERTRLGGKVEGVKLALSYIEEHARVFPPGEGDVTGTAESDAPISAFGWCRLCSLTAEHTHMSDPIIRPIPPEEG